MNEILPFLSQLSGAGNFVSVGLVVLLLLFGKLRPKAQFDELKESRDKLAEETVAQIAIWKDALELERETRAVLEKQLADMSAERAQTAEIVHNLLGMQRKGAEPDG